MWNTVFLIVTYLIFLALLVYLFLKLRVRILEKTISEISGQLVVKQIGFKEKHLVMGSVTQGISADFPTTINTYWGKIAKIAADHCNLKDKPRILIIGLGANTTSKLLNSLSPNAGLTIVEIDPLIVEICNRHFDLKTMHNTQIIVQDIFKLLDQPTLLSIPFDCVITDVVTRDAKFFMVDQSTPRFLKFLKQVLQPDGLLIINRPAHTKESQEQTNTLVDVLKDYFPTITKNYVIDKYSFQNELVIAPNH